MCESEVEGNTMKRKDVCNVDDDKLPLYWMTFIGQSIREEL